MDRPNRDAADRDAGQKFVYLKLAFLDEECQLTLYFFSNDTTMTQPKTNCVPKMGSEDNLESNGVCMKYENENVRGIKSIGKVKSEKCILPKNWCT